MKKLGRIAPILLLCLILCVSLLPGSVRAAEVVPEGWTGIYTVDDLRSMADNLSGQYIQMADIEFDPDEYWTPIGVYTTGNSKPFQGKYDGNGFVIRYLQIESTADYIGLFGYTDGCIIENVSLEDVNISGGRYTGGIAGYANREISGCSISGTVIGGEYTGGIAGKSQGNITESHMSGIVRGGDNTGGIAGSTSGGITGCNVSGTVRGGNNVGGVVGYCGWYSATSGSLNTCRNQATIIGTGCIGGIAGFFEEAMAQDCYNTGSIIGSGTCVGGIVGKINNKSSGVERCYSIGSVRGNNDVGGIVGNRFGNVSFSYYLDYSETIPTSSYGTQVSEDRLRLRGNYEQWDFDTVWTMAGSMDYIFAELRCLTHDEFSIPEPELDDKDRIQVRTKYDLFNIMADPTASYIQMADIEFSAADFTEDGDFYNMGASWRPIGTQSTPFSGSYDGAGFEIRGLQINTTEDDQGLFGYTENATLQYITMRETVISGGDYTGGIVGRSLSTEIKDCHTVSSVISGGSSVGGIAGLAFSVTIRNCSTSGSINGIENVGGIIGNLTGHFYKNGNTFGSNAVQECRNEAVLSGNSQVGGISGKVVRARLGVSTPTGVETHTSGPITIQNCFNLGSISGSTDCGGILGMAYFHGTTQSYYSMDGITVSNCYYLNTTVTSPDNTSGTAFTADQLQNQESFDSTWDFDTIWIMLNCGDKFYPELRCFTISGILTIAGNSVYNGQVTANVSRVKQLRTYNAAWYVGDVQVGMGEPFTVPAEAVGNSLTLVITSTNDIYRGSITSRSVSVGKAPCATIPQPSEELDKSSTSILVSIVSGQEYSLDRENWQLNGRFDGLQPGTVYTVYTRMAETELYLMSEAMEAVTVTTEAQALACSVCITGTPEYSRALGVSIEQLIPPNATYDLEWRCGDTVLGTGETYVPTAEDIGQSITVTAIGTGKYNGEVVSASVTVEPCDIAIISADLAVSYTFTHEGITPMVALKNGNQNLRNGTDYTIEYLNNTNAGDAIIRVSGIGNYKGSKDIGFTISPKPIEQLNVSAIPDMYYTGSVIIPELTILHGSYQLKEGQDYTISCSDNINLGTATVTVNGINNYCGSLEQNYIILSQPLNTATVSIMQQEYEYTESEITPDVTVILDGRTLISETDYTLSYSNNLREGIATITVTGVNGYSGNVSTTFRIVGHVYSEWQTRIEPTCTEDGLRFKVCSGCDAEADGHEVTEIIPALDHDLIHYAAQAPTCTETGWDEYDDCSRCNYTTYVENPAFGHTPGEPVRENENPATTEAEGSYDEVVYCTACGEELRRETKTIDKLSEPLVISSIKADVTAANAGEKITWTAKASGGTEPLQYYFILYKDRTKLKSRSYSTVNTYSYTPAEPGTYKVRVYVKDADETKKNKLSAGVTVTQAVPPVILLQPSDQAVAAGKTAVFTVTAEGEGLTYQWQYSRNDGGNWYNKTGATTNSYTVTAKTSYDGILYRCRVTNSAGAEAISDAAKLTVLPKPVITIQPANQTVAAGEKATFKVVASGTGLTYQWQYKTAGSTTWKNKTGATSSSYTVTAKTSYDGMLYRCKVNNKGGSVYTAEAKLTVTAAVKPAITTQPTARTAAVGETVSFTVTASGTGLTYQWQYSGDYGKTWTNKTGATSASYTVTAKASYNGMLYRCRVKNSGGTVYSSKVRLTVSGVKPKILSQPAARTAAAGESVTFKVVAAGVGMTYQWQYSKDGGQTWYNKSGATSASYTTTANTKYNGILYRCRVTNSIGSVKSDAAQLTVG